jgi:hypothetical protein
VSVAKINSDMSAAWLVAAQTLGVRVTAPYEIRLESGESIAFEAWLPDFGAPGGAIVLDLADQTGREQWLPGRWCSKLSDDYEQFDRALFVDTLNDWGWYGPGQPPAWFKGYNYRF